ncbi:Dabb family protein [Algoriphagus machipongonensis]|uniref:Stress responsive A/B Barrel Domain superfamily n=1 Tax=Algoriphagus machipongonensis TaxID=388413 RepID=A3HU93_9BACT|nr:Dabb family protein [Algoriphagus machipongonensis]EAZ81715.1 stress responsive A/B Barrel Domain superfamily [Algoriphagus machipongonensis]
MITHSLFFRLKYPIGSPEEHTFFNALAKLSTISGVENFTILKQISQKNEFDYGLNIEFENQEAFQTFHQNPHHALFFKIYWPDFVEDCMELDFEKADLVDIPN